MEDQLCERPPTDVEVKQASEAAQALASALTPQGLSFSVRRGGDQVTVELPQSVAQLMLDLLTRVARGQRVTVLPDAAVLTTKEAADLLNVSRPFLVQLLEKGEIDFHRVGTHVASAPRMCSHSRRSATSSVKAS